MPAQQLVYEGADLQALIQRVVDEHGPARIRPPERRRKGGLFGFFAREVYVISVDQEATDRATARPATAGAPTAPAAASAAAGGSPFPRVPTAGGAAAPAPTPAAGMLADLLDTEDDLDLAPAQPPSHPADAGAVPGTPATSTFPGATTGPVPGTPSAGLPAAPREALATKPFRQILDEVASSLGEEPGTYRPAPEKIRRLAPLVPPAVASRAPASQAGPAPASQAGTAPAPAVPQDDHPAPEQRVPAAPVIRTLRSVPLQPAQPAGPEPSPAAAPSAGAPVAAARAAALLGPTLSTALVDLLRAAGFPETRLALERDLPPGRSTLEAAFAALPQPRALPDGPGGLVAIVGDARLVRPAARSLALTVGCPADEVAVAAPGAATRQSTPALRVRTPEQAAAMAGAWRRCRTGVVAVYAPPLGASQVWTRDVLRALRPSAVWGMASATTKPDDVRRWAEELGGIDALAVTDVAATATPAAIVAAGIPVARLDDEPATPARWASVIADLVGRL